MPYITNVGGDLFPVAGREFYPRFAPIGANLELETLNVNNP